jgi:uncharacterized protein (DUF58 family)
MSVRQQWGKPRGSVSWLGIAALFGGATLIWLYFAHPFLTNSTNVIYPLTYLGGGLGMIAWGLRSLSDEALAVFRRLRKRASNQYRVRMPREAVIYFFILLVLCAGALMGGSNMLMLVFGLMAGPFVLNGQVTLVILRRLSVARGLPAHATVGETFRVKLTLTNRKRLMSSWMVTVEDTVQGPREHLLPVALFACVPPRSTREAFFEICAALRGTYEFGPMRVISRFPLGLMERSIELGDIERLTVYPRIGRMLPDWHTSVETGEPVSDSAWAASGINSDEFHSLREYRGGDNPRAIHWRTTARLNQLMVREYQHTQRHDLLLAVELWLPPRPAPADLERVELAVSFAASICVDHLQHTSEATIELVVGGRETFRESGWSGPAALAGILEHLALVEGGAADGLAAAARAAGANGSHGLRKLLITSRPAWVSGAERMGAGDPRIDLSAQNFEVFEAEPQELLRFIDFGRDATGGLG